MHTKINGKNTPTGAEFEDFFVSDGRKEMGNKRIPVQDKRGWKQVNT